MATVPYVSTGNDGLSPLASGTELPSCNTMSLTQRSDSTNSSRTAHHDDPAPHQPRRSRRNAPRTPKARSMPALPVVILEKKDQYSALPYENAMIANQEMRDLLKTFQGARLVAGNTRKIILLPGKKNFQLWIDDADENSKRGFWTEFALHLGGPSAEVTQMEIGAVKVQIKKDNQFKKRQERIEEEFCANSLKAIGNLSELVLSTPSSKKRNAHTANLVDAFKATQLKSQERVKTKKGKHLNEVMDDNTFADDSSESVDDNDVMEGTQDTIDEPEEEEE